MLFDKQGNIVVITRESQSFDMFFEKFRTAYDQFKNDHIILNLFSLNTLKPLQLLEFISFSNTHRNLKKSFVIVTDALQVDDIPDELVIAPTLQEAFDIIEMEDIERDLDF
ncbi:ribonuclease Z [Ascidiimonas aurantiaca]|uniref:ribonuclease Z n=1 Tax=Ascidiimonas aurantiaca TaxID=1685432 RepID=UPI0030EECF4A